MKKNREDVQVSPCPQSMPTNLGLKTYMEKRNQVEQAAMHVGTRETHVSPVLVE